MILVDILGIILSLLFLIGKFWAGVLGRVMTGLIVGANSAIVPLYIRIYIFPNPEEKKRKEKKKIIYIYIYIQLFIYLYLFRLIYINACRYLIKN